METLVVGIDGYADCRHVVLSDGGLFLPIEYLMDGVWT